MHAPYDEHSERNEYSLGAYMTYKTTTGDGEEACIRILIQALSVSDEGLHPAFKKRLDVEGIHWEAIKREEAYFQHG